MSCRDICLRSGDIRRRNLPENNEHVYLGQVLTRLDLVSSLFETKGRTCKRGTVQLARTRDSPRAKQSYTRTSIDHRTELIGVATRLCRRALPSKALPSCLSSGPGPTYKLSPRLISVVCRPVCVTGRKFCCCLSI
eukprot:scaffold34602_cov72-Phaeocystis_antarctica.AAC.1